MSKFHVSQIETHVRSLYEVAHWKPGLDDVANLSRLLALHAVHLVLGGDADDAGRIVEITDGTDDHGIDAIGVDTNSKLVVFVQSKWRQDGTGSMALGDVLKFLDGVRLLIGMTAGSEPSHAAESTKLAIRGLLRTPGARIRLVTVSTASEKLAAAVEQPITTLLGQLNDLEGIEPLATHRHLAQSDLFSSIAERSRPTVDINLQMLDWGRASEPQRIFYGRVSAAEIAGWFRSHGTDLFAENIRVVIPRSDINEGILQTLKDEPDRFAFYNNGITILAEDIQIGPGGALNRDVGYFSLKDASVVNGAQTVSTLATALGTDYEDNLGNAYVLVRCIEVPKDQEDLGRRITRYANTQNEVSSQDFAFLDQEQHRLVRELRVLGQEYVLRSAEVPRSSDPDKIIDLREAAVALACATSAPGPSVIAKREVSRLFSDQTLYKQLFNKNTDPLRLSRSVRIARKIDEILDGFEASSDGVTAGVAVHGRRVIAHQILRALGDSFLQSPDSDVESFMATLEVHVALRVTMLVSVFPNNAYPGNVFKNQSRVAALLKDAGTALPAEATKKADEAPAG